MIVFSFWCESKESKVPSSSNQSFRGLRSSGRRARHNKKPLARTQQGRLLCRIRLCLNLGLGLLHCSTRIDTTSCATRSDYGLFDLVFAMIWVHGAIVRLGPLA